MGEEVPASEAPASVEDNGKEGEDDGDGEDEEVQGSVAPPAAPEEDGEDEGEDEDGGEDEGEGEDEDGGEDEDEGEDDGDEDEDSGEDEEEDDGEDEDDGDDEEDVETPTAPVPTVNGGDEFDVAREGFAKAEEKTKEILKKLNAGLKDLTKKEKKIDASISQVSQAQNEG